MNFRQKWGLFFATGGYIGNSSLAPGTLGSLLGLPFCFLLSKTDLPVAILCTLIFIFWATWIAQEAERQLNRKDPGCIVIDEIAGIIVALLGLPFNFACVTAGFVLFRFFDILKPFPIRYLEKKFKGGVGIVLDDVAAGIFSNFMLRVGFILINS
jgi:phosphatidylglycerophosphatase A